MHVAGYEGIGADEYRRRIRAWALYDWGNSAFATTILAAVLPVYYSRVAGETLASPAVATAYWTAGLSVALFVVAIISPILGTISDLRRGKKPLLAVFAGLGVVSTGLLVLVGSGDWLLASLFFVLGRIGFGAANVFYDALLPHVARPEDRDRVSSLGYALGYTGGGVLLAVNAVMIFALGEIPGSRLSFLSVALWWAVFTIPVLRRVPEPPAATAPDEGPGTIRASFARLGQTFRNLRRYRELFKYLVAFFIYNDGIGTIIGVAVIYGAELGFAATELILALLLVQFVGIPFTLLFGRIPGHGAPGRRPIVLAFVVFNLAALPVVGAFAARTMDAALVGRPGPDFETVDGAVGRGEWPVTGPAFRFDGAWEVISQDRLAGARDDYAFASSPGAELILVYNGREVEITYSRGPDHGGFRAEIDGKAAFDDNEAVNAFNTVERYGETVVADAGAAGIHTLRLVAVGPVDDDASGARVGVASIEVLEPTRQSSLVAILGVLGGLQVAGALFALAFGRALFTRISAAFDTKRTVALALAVYSVIAVWGFFLDTVLEFWFIAWMVAIVQGGSQALSRSLYAAMSPTSMSGEFFGLFSIMEKASAILGPFVFAGAVILFDSSRPAVLMVVAFFVVGGYLLSRVDVEEGRRAAEEADRAGRA